MGVIVLAEKGEEGERMKKIECPFYKYDKNRMIKCEDNRTEFDSRAELLEHRIKYCGDVKEYRSCITAQRLENKATEGRRWEMIVKDRERRIQSLRSKLEIAEAKASGGEAVIRALLTKLGTESIVLTRADLKNAKDKKVTVKVLNDGYEINTSRLNELNDRTS